MIPKVSVIVTTFNAEKSIANSLNSVIKQEGSGKDFELEIIVIDDCSTDSTLSILRKSNIAMCCTTLSNSGGPNKGRNIGLKRATGDFICFLDHDDVWHPQKILMQLRATDYASIVTCGYEVINSSLRHRTVLRASNDGIKIFKTNEVFLKKLSREKRNVQNTYLSTIMISKVWKDILFEEHFGMVDFDWTLRLFENKASAEVRLNLVSRHVTGNNLSLNGDYRRKDYYYSLMCLESYEKNYPKEVALALKRINGSRARYCYLVGEMQEARKYFLKAMPGVKEMLYYLTSYYGSHWVRKRFLVFG